MDENDLSILSALKMKAVKSQKFALAGLIRQAERCLQDTIKEKRAEDVMRFIAGYKH